eukprot:942816-Prorocentrum_minimum.AAC.1
MRAPVALLNPLPEGGLEPRGAGGAGPRVPKSAPPLPARGGALIRGRWRSGGGGRALLGTHVVALLPQRTPPMGGPPARGRSLHARR